VAVTAPAVRLDTFVLGLTPAPRRIALWIDVEGAGHDVLEGLRHVADRVALVHVEVETVEVWVGQKLAADVDALMAGWGFAPLARGFWYAQRDVVYAHTRVLAAERGAIRPVVWEAWLRSYPRRWVEDRAKRGRRAGLEVAVRGRHDLIALRPGV
jgi:hypothetical protein